ncbi:MAG: Arylsulfatase [Chloroflexi bacterium ADurb.Bin325]|nr:MAG: Arylsulfatase [Chloroflexi bacterium ADurb.Bin325]
MWDQPHLTQYGPARVDLTSALAAARAKHPARPVVFLSYPSIVPEEACQTRWIVDRAIHYVKERDRSRPFCLKVSFVDPHDPYDPPARFLDLIDPAAIPPPLASDDPTLLALLPRLRRIRFAQRAADVSPEEWRTVRRYYLASLAFIGEQVGCIRVALGAEGLAGCGPAGCRGRRDRVCAESGRRRLPLRHHLHCPGPTRSDP